MTVPFVQGIILGLVQGATEFLPVSSTGHLVLVPRFFGWEDPGLAFDAIIHIGTLFALLWTTRAFVVGLVADALVRGSKDARRLCLQIVMACVPALAVGALFGDAIEARLRAPGVIACSLAFWGIVLWMADRYADKLAAPDRA